jgi:hypothetical protein
MGVQGGGCGGCGEAVVSSADDGVVDESEFEAESARAFLRSAFMRLRRLSIGCI